MVDVEVTAIYRFHPAGSRCFTRILEGGNTLPLSWSIIRGQSTGFLGAPLGMGGGFGPCGAK
jgi:hypothetical protein